MCRCTGLKPVYLYILIDSIDFSYVFTWYTDKQMYRPYASYSFFLLFFVVTETIVVAVLRWRWGGGGGGWCMYTPLAPLGVPSMLVVFVGFSSSSSSSLFHEQKREVFSFFLLIGVLINRAWTEGLGKNVVEGRRGRRRRRFPLFTSFAFLDALYKPLVLFVYKLSICLRI